MKANFFPGEKKLKTERFSRLYDWKLDYGYIRWMKGFNKLFVGFCFSFIYLYFFGLGIFSPRYLLISRVLRVSDERKRERQRQRGRERENVRSV